MTTFDSFTEFLRTLIMLAKFSGVYCREVILDISSLVVDESKEIVLIEFASLSSNDTLRTTCRLPKYSLLNFEVI